jgi:hypothetical protein
MPVPDWLDDSTRQRLVDLFRIHGVSGSVSLMPTTGRDEAIFLVAPRDAATMREASLIPALMNALGRKVWVVTDDSAWSGDPIRLTA